MTLHLTPEELMARNKEKQRQWRESHPDRVRAFHIKHNTKPQVKARKLDWARENKDLINERRRRIYHDRKKQAKEAAEKRQETSA
jgi:hypothetical protein